MLKPLLFRLLFIVTAFYSPVYSASTILIVGDSISAGYGLSNVNEGWVALLEQRLEEEQRSDRVINASISGDTTTNGLQRLPSLLQQYQPDVVVIELGGNDGLRATSPRVIKENLEAMVRQSIASGARVLLVGIDLPPNYGTSYLTLFASLFTQVAQETDTPLLPSIVVNVGDQPHLMQADGIHPNAKGQPQLLNNVWPLLQPLLPQASDHNSSSKIEE